MSGNLDAVQHLESAARMVMEEQGSIQVVGRPLTPEEERRLQNLEGAEEDITSAIEFLKAGDSGPGFELPPDGRYTLGNDVLAVALRVDLNRSNIVSGDVFAVAQGHREYVASFRSLPGATVALTDNPLDIVAEDVEGKRALGLLLFNTAAGVEISALLSMDSPIKALPVAQAVTLAGRYVGEAMRELGIEMETEAGTDPMPAWDYQTREMTVEICLEDAGFDVFNVGFRDEIPNPSSGKWDDTQLHGLMTQFAQEPLNRKSWNLHLLMVQVATNPNLLGIMFDSGDMDLNLLPRQGAAVFQKTIKSIDNWQRKLIQTTVHELGHALNLAHRYERPVGRADSTSFMNYDWRYLGGGNREKYWRDFSFTFDPDELAFLRHGPLENIIPGSAEFHTIPYWENPDGGYVPYVPEVPSDDFRINLVAPPTGTLFKFAQPVLLTVELVNNSGVPQNIPRFVLDPKAGMLEMVVKRRTGIGGGQPEASVFRPIVHRCYSMDLATADVVPQGGKLVENVNLTFGSAGFTFIEPGEYEVQAVFMWQSGSSIFTIKSNPMVIRIAYPKSDDEERDAQLLFRTDVGSYLALGGSDVLDKAEEALDEVVERRQRKVKTVTDPVVATILRAKAINLTREFIHYDQGKYRTRSADPKKASEIFTAIGSAIKKVLDPESSKSTAKLAAAVKRRIKK
jgi:hypothetical protein